MQEFYAGNLRAELFGALLSISGFLFAAKTFIIVHMQKEVFGTDAYQGRVKAHLKYRDIDPLEPLKTLSALLHWSVCASLAASIAQVTLGLIQQNWAALLSLVFAASSIAVMGYCLHVIRRNLGYWIDGLEDEAKKRQSKSAEPPKDE